MPDRTGELEAQDRLGFVMADDVGEGPRAALFGEGRHDSAPVFLNEIRRTVLVDPSGPAIGAACQPMPSTASELADRYADEFEDQFKDIKEKELDGSDRLSGKAAIFQRVLGMTNHGHVLVLRQWIAVYRGNLFTVRATLSTGADEKVRKELEKIIRSFKFL